MAHVLIDGKPPVQEHIHSAQEHVHRYELPDHLLLIAAGLLGGQAFLTIALLIACHRLGLL